MFSLQLPLKNQNHKAQLLSLETLMNAAPMDDFEGRSANEMHYYVHAPFDMESPFQFYKVADSSIFEQVPFLKLGYAFYKYLLEQPVPIKLTTHGNLPVKVVKYLYGLGIMKDEHIESGLYKLYKEEDSLSIHTLAIVSKLAGITRKVGGKLVLTTTGTKLTEEHNLQALFELLFKTFVSKFNWSYHDGYGNNPVAQLGAVFTIELLSKYGALEREDRFYSEKYLKAFPGILEYMEPTEFGAGPADFHRCYTIRTFDRFLVLFGFVEIRKEAASLSAKKWVKKTDALDKLFVFEQ